MSNWHPSKVSNLGISILSQPCHMLFNNMQILAPLCVCLCVCLPLLNTVTRGVTSRSSGVLNGYPAAAHTQQLSSRSRSAEDRAPCMSSERLKGHTLSSRGVYTHTQKALTQTYSPYDSHTPTLVAGEQAGSPLSPCCREDQRNLKHTQNTTVSHVYAEETQTAAHVGTEVSP